jgi:hypothetical protein
MRLVISAEVRGAISSLKEFDQKVDQTAANTSAASAEMEGASKSINSLSSAADTAKTALAGLAAGAAIGGLVILAGVAYEAYEKFKLLHDAQKALNDILPEGAKGAAKQVEAFFELKENIDLAKQGLIDSKGVVDEYNNSLGKTAGSVQNLGEVEAKVAAAGDAYIRFTLLKAAAAAAFAKASDYALQKEVASLQGLDKFKGIGDIGVNPLAGESAAADSAFQKAIDASRQKRKDAITKELDDLETQFKTVGDKLEKQAAELAKKFGFNFFENTKTPKVIDEAKELEGILRQIQKVEEDTAKIETEPLRTKIADSQQATETQNQSIRLQLLNTQLKEIAKKAADDPANKYYYQILGEKLKQEIFAVENPNLKVGIAKPEDLTQGLDKEVQKALDAVNKLHVKKGTKDLLSEIIAATGFDSLGMKQFIDYMAKQAELLKATLERTVSGSLEGLGEAIGNAIGGGKFNLNSLAKVLGDALKSIGKVYIETAVAFLLAKQTFEKFLISNPYLAIAAGVALEAFGAALEAKVNNTKAFASGGIVTGPTNAIVGEAGTEVIFPLNQLNKFVKGIQSNAQAQLVATTKIQGPDILIAIARAQKNQNTVS